jgi:hypothetical protein
LALRFLENAVRVTVVFELTKVLLPYELLGWEAFGDIFIRESLWPRFFLTL